MGNVRNGWVSCFGACTPCDGLFGELVVAYGRNSPGYHTIEHAHEVVEALNALHLELGSRPSREEQLAAWCHDVIYVQGACDNEIRSARFAADAARSLQWPEASVSKVTNLVLGTAHQGAPTPDQALLADADLSTLAKDWAGYVSDTERLRVEVEIDDEAWLQARQRVIEAFLASPTIFSNRTAIMMWEQSARANLLRELNLVTALVCPAA